MTDEEKNRLNQLIFESDSEYQMPKAKAELIEAIEAADLPQSEFIAERIRTVALDLINGYSPHQIWERHNEKWDVSYSHVRQMYVKEARQFLADNILTEETDIRIDLLAKYQYLFQLNLVNKDFKEARAVLDSITRLTQTITSTVTVLGNIQTINLVEVIRDESQNEIDGTSD
jgi:hypothetical protein